MGYAGIPFLFQGDDDKAPAGVLDTKGLRVIISSTEKRKVPMFAKTLISTLSVLTIVIGLIVFIRTGEYAIFTIGMIAYFFVAISQNICARCQRQGSSNS